MPLPLVITRKIDLFLRTAAHANEVIAAYPDRLVIVRLKLKTSIPPAAHGPGGGDVLVSLNAYGRPVSLPWDAIDWVECHSVFVPAPIITFRVRGPGAKRTFSLPSPQGDALREVFEARVPGRLLATEDTPARSRGKIKARLILAWVVWAAITCFLLWMEGQVARGAPAPANGRARLVWAVLTFLHNHLGDLPAKLMLIGLGLLMALSTSSTILAGRTHIPADPEATPGQD